MKLFWKKKSIKKYFWLERERKEIYPQHIKQHQVCASCLLLLFAMNIKSSLLKPAVLSKLAEWQCFPTSSLWDRVLDCKRAGEEQCPPPDHDQKCPPHYRDHDQRWQTSAALRYLHWARREQSRKPEGNTELCLWGDLDEVAEQLPREIFVPISPPGASGLKDFADWKSSKWTNGIWQGLNGQGGLEAKKPEPETPLTLLLCTSHILCSMVLTVNVAFPGGWFLDFSTRLIML